MYPFSPSFEDTITWPPSTYATATPPSVETTVVVHVSQFGIEASAIESSVHGPPDPEASCTDACEPTEL